ncbi:Ketosamine-3-kinase [Fusarium oxysporum f. sp. albedinis]|nr:Ketosamine-3-kinase [Fusarium oxysporum f. sp. albedinis]
MLDLGHRDPIIAEDVEVNSVQSQLHRGTYREETGTKGIVKHEMHHNSTQLYHYQIGECLFPYTCLVLSPS